MPSPTIRGIILSQPISGPAAAFLARTTGLDNFHRKAYIKLINGLVSDGVWSKLDLLQIYAAPDQTTANLNLISTDFTASTTGSPVWTADRGYTTASGKWVDTNWNPATNGVQFTQDAAHVGYWSGTTASQFQFTIGLKTTSNGQLRMVGRASGDTSNISINDNTAASTPANADGGGFFVGVRTNSTTKQIWRNGSQLGGDITRATLAVQSFILQSAGDNVNSGNSAAIVTRAMFAGNALSAAEIGLFYTRMSIFMTTIGAVP